MVGAQFLPYLLGTQEVGIHHLIFPKLLGMSYWHQLLRTCVEGVREICQTFRTYFALY
jgi:hypothetical protein